MHPPGNFLVFEASKRYFLHFESSFTKEYKDHEQMIITNINFTADFFVQLNQLRYKNSDCRNYWVHGPQLLLLGDTCPSGPLPHFLRL